MAAGRLHIATKSGDSHTPGAAVGGAKRLRRSDRLGDPDRDRHGHPAG